jgi:hypothetical protein
LFLNCSWRRKNGGKTVYTLYKEGFKSMFKRIGPLTIIGILIIIAAAILFLVPSLSVLWNWYVFSIIWVIFGVFLVAVDFIYTQRRIGNKIFDPRLFVFIKIVIIGFIALIINAVILMNALGSNAGFFYRLCMSNFLHTRYYYWSRYFSNSSSNTCCKIY